MKKELNTNKKPDMKKKSRKFFLYVEDKGFVSLSPETGAMPTFNTKDILYYATRKAAQYAKEFFLRIRLAEAIEIVATI